jgi:biopolymer transport protein ExbD
MSEQEVNSIPDEEVLDEPVKIVRKKREADMDMTPMVDVVFNLLIFFMITASFGMQKSIAIPDPESDQMVLTKQPEKENEDENILIQITKENQIFVEGEEATTQQELYAKLRDRQYADGQKQTRHALITAEVDAYHETVVRVLDAATGVGMNTIRLKTEGALE